MLSQGAHNFNTKLNKKLSFCACGPWVQGQIFTKKEGENNNNNSNVLASFKMSLCGIKFLKLTFLKPDRVPKEPK